MRPWLHAPSLVALLLTALLCSAGASAYRPPARTLIERAAARHIDRATRSLKVEAEVQLYDATGTPKGAAFPERTWFQAPGSMRRETEGLDGIKIEVRVDDKLFTRGPGQAGSTARAPVDPLFDQVTTAPPLDDVQGAERMLKDLKAVGVNTEVVSYARFDGRVSYLIGSKSWETDKPQLWIDKETLLVTRLVIVTKGTDGKPRRTDIRYLGWGSPVGGNWYPASVEVHVDDKLVKRTAVRSVDRNIPIDATSFAMR